jgi:hypothetical protein
MVREGSQAEESVREKLEQVNVMEKLNMTRPDSKYRLALFTNVLFCVDTTLQPLVGGSPLGPLPCSC